MTSPRTISFRIAPEKVAELDLIAKAMERNRSYLLNEAVETFLSEQRRFAALVEEGLKASRKGELIDDEDMGAKIDSWVEGGMRFKAVEPRKVRARA
jgi:predicted transcriptional regulator